MEDNKQWDLYGVSHSRKVGKTQAMIRAIKATLEEGGKAGVAGCKDPQPILDRLKGFGIDAKAEPMIATQPLKAEYGFDGYEEYLSGFKGGQKKKTGYIFYCG